MQRGDIYYANLSPVVGSEQGGYRPVVIIQNNKGNKYSTTLIIAPISSAPNKHPLPTHVVIHSEYLEKKSIILLEQIRTIDKLRMCQKIGEVSKELQTKIDQAIKTSLDI
ncbi:type II toxin-antitoxin system PemK/MazF family toxin [Tannockella kyphosi]|uniref:type II toxin-antitoxin system PemK/MazF family toxin n=1 Tax=Tannockella kyphosi TaxID=2899121 RepID=UPI002011285A|nr:type II toxin-antitoxin system PemK/MazF family toxin [Tannockella kyphosi]